MTPDQFNSLLNELRLDPEGLGYAQHLPDDPVRAVELITSKDFTMVKSRMINGRTILEHCSTGKSILRKIKAAADADAVMEVVWAFLKQESGLDIGSPATRTSIDELVTSGSWEQAEGDELKGLAIQPASRAEVLGIPAPSARDIVEAWGEQ
jgi:hypothetical protein